LEEKRCQEKVACPLFPFNRAEKKGLIDSADIFIQIRIVRNDIAHEYHIETLRDIYKKVLELAPYLLKCVEKIRGYFKTCHYTTEL